MNEFDVVILPRAEADIERNARWWAENHDTDQAIKWFLKVREQVLSLSYRPDS